MGTSEVLLTPLTGRASQKWERLALREAEDWVYVRSDDGATVLAVDQVSEAGVRDPADAVIYPELHTRLVTWWLVHAWRSADLLADTLDNLARWHITSGAVTARAVLEEAGSLVDEQNAIAQAWRTGKAAAKDSMKRPTLVRETLAPALLKAAFGSRMRRLPVRVIGQAEPFPGDSVAVGHACERLSIWLSVRLSCSEAHRYQHTPAPAVLPHASWTRTAVPRAGATAPLFSTTPRRDESR